MGGNVEFRLDREESKCWDSPQLSIFRRGLQEDGYKDKWDKGRNSLERGALPSHSRMNGQADRNAHWDTIRGCCRVGLGVRVCGQADKTRRTTRQSPVYFLKSHRANTCSFLLFKSLHGCAMLVFYRCSRQLLHHSGGSSLSLHCSRLIGKQGNCFTHLLWKDKEGMEVWDAVPARKLIN